MDAMETLNGLLRENPSYACLCLLESAVTSRKYWPEAGLPEALAKDMIQALGQTRFREAESLLLDAGVLIDIMIASYAIFIVTSLWDMVVQIIVKRTCKKSNILFKAIGD